MTLRQYEPNPKMVPYVCAKLYIYMCVCVSDCAAADARAGVVSVSTHSADIMMCARVFPAWAVERVGWQ